LQTNKLCVIMVVRNEGRYIEEAINSVLSKPDVIIYIVDDNSTDNTLEKILELKRQFEGRIIYAKNQLNGKVEAYRNIKNLPKANYYLFLDGDDFFSDDWVRFDENLKPNCVFYHDLTLFYSSTHYERLPSPDISRQSPETLIRSLVLLPKASWLVPQNLILNYLDIPKGVLFEDIWFSLVTYKFASKIEKLNHQWYMYRQHEDQVFGKQNQKGKAILEYRTQRILNSLEAIAVAREAFGEELTEPLKKFRILITMKPLLILVKLGVREFIVFLLKIRFPIMLLKIKRLMRRQK